MIAPFAPFSLVTPSIETLPDFRAALERGWRPDTLDGEAGRLRALASSAADPAGYLAALIAETPGDARITLPDGSTVPRLPNRTWWIWSEGFAGTLSLRWQPGTEALPPTCLGHIGYHVVPWRRRRGLATRALATALPEAAARGLAHVEITCAPDNHASRRVIEANGGTLIERFRAPAALGGHETQRFRIPLR